MAGVEGQDPDWRASRRTAMVGRIRRAGAASDLDAPVRHRSRPAISVSVSCAIARYAGSRARMFMMRTRRSRSAPVAERRAHAADLAIQSLGQNHAERLSSMRSTRHGLVSLTHDLHPASEHVAQGP